MGNKRNLAIAGLAAIFAAGGLNGALANDRCGGALVIDQATTLGKIARRCNVSLAGLREANPGVDPGYVTPGTYVALPDEILDYANGGGATPAPSPEPTPVPEPTSGAGNDFVDYGQLPDDYALDPVYQEDPRVHDANLSTSARLTDLQRASSDPVWLKEATGGGQRSSLADRLSYQQRSALRMHNAGLPALPPSSYTPIEVGGSAQPAQMIACNVLRQHGQDGKLHKVMKITSTPTGGAYVQIEPAANGGYDCTLVSGEPAATPGVPPAHYGLPYGVAPRVKPSPGFEKLYRLPDYDAINPDDSAQADRFSVSGKVTGEWNGCLMLENENGETWALAAAPGSEALIGKHLIAWGVASQSGACGAGPTMVVSHAVYAEPY